MLELKNVRKEYLTPGSDEKTSVLEDVSLSVERRETVAVVGPSGSGKSTLLNIAGALDRPTAGEVYLDGEDISIGEEDRLAGIRNRRIGFIFQHHHLLPQCTVMENVIVPSLVCSDRAIRRDAEHRAAELLHTVGLSQYKLHRPGQISGGQRQRVALVRALINRPALLLADEPTGSLDNETSNKVLELLLALNEREDVALVMVSHAESVSSCADKVYRLSGGRLVEESRSASHNHG